MFWTTVQLQLICFQVNVWHPKCIFFCNSHLAHACRCRPKHMFLSTTEKKTLVWLSGRPIGSIFMFIFINLPVSGSSYTSLYVSV